MLPPVRELLINDDETEIVDIPCYCQVRWLSRGNIGLLSKILKLKHQIVSFYEKQNKQCDLSDVDFIRNVAFLCDLMSKQNEINIFLQGSLQPNLFMTYGSKFKHLGKN